MPQAKRGRKAKDGEPEDEGTDNGQEEPEQDESDEQDEQDEPESEPNDDESDESDEEEIEDAVESKVGADVNLRIKSDRIEVDLPRDGNEKQTLSLIGELLDKLS